MNRVMSAAVVGLVVVVSGCSALTGEDCTSILRFPINVRIEDSVTGALIAPGSQIVSRNGTTVDTIQVQPGTGDGDAVAVGTGAGVFDLTISKPAYQVWTRNAIDVDRDRCGQPETQTITALLQHL